MGMTVDFQLISGFCRDVISALVWDFTHCRNRNILDDGADRLSRNVYTELPFYAAQNPRRTEISTFRCNGAFLTTRILIFEKLLEDAIRDCALLLFKTLRTGDADLRFYIKIMQDG